MPFRSNMQDHISRALDTAVRSNLSAASAGNDLYEAYVWTLVLEAAQNEGATIQLRTRSGRPVNEFTFRTSPTSIFSETRDYGHAELIFPRAPALEAHVGIYVSGKSKVNHECDVAVLYREEAEICRDQHVHPRSSKVLLAIECKYYLSSSLGLDLGRSFLGLIDDIYTHGRFFVSTQNSGSVDRLFSRHKKEFEIGLSPLAPKEETRLLGSFEKIFRDYKARS